MEFEEWWQSEIHLRDFYANPKEAALSGWQACAAQAEERDRRTVEQRNLEIAHGILCIAEGYAIHLELKPTDGYYNITMALCNRLRAERDRRLVADAEVSLYEELHSAVRNHCLHAPDSLQSAKEILTHAFHICQRKRAALGGISGSDK